MGEPLKTFFSSALARRLARGIAHVYPRFPVRAFTNDACRGLDTLDLIDRGRQIASALGAHLPPSYPEAIEILLQSRSCRRGWPTSWPDRSIEQTGRRCYGREAA